MLLLLVFGLVNCVVGFPRTYESIQGDYHGQVGIPKATWIRNAEAASDFDGARIVGGSPAQLGAHSHFAGLLVQLVSGEVSMCGGSLLSNTKLVTAARCWQSKGYQGRSFIVVLGSIRLFSGGVRISTKNVEIHADYDINNLNNDIAMITIPHTGFTGSINSIALPFGLLERMLYAGNRAVAVGFGRQKDGASKDALNEISLDVISNQACASTYGSNVVINSTLCTSGANGFGPCLGDTGGPLDYSYEGIRYLIGVSSFVAERGCEAGLPAGFTRVTSFSSWIRVRL
ncbi:unnamed protein product [Pieris brassicae]|uniref:Peptidase S1 domain-containing protein n=1 Tax=Pieris brassicae TaxID=7116 RepID=A0A9P0TNB9_PIEBR|nr:unnamed protein product [Pieris brassicae]